MEAAAIVEEISLHNPKHQAYQWVKMMERIVEKSNTTMAKFHYAAMLASYLIDSDNWNADLKPMDMRGMEPASQ